MPTIQASYSSGSWEALQAVRRPGESPAPCPHPGRLAGKARAYLYGFRQVPETWFPRLEDFLRGTSFLAIEELSLLLLERPTAVARSKETQEHLFAIVKKQKDTSKAKAELRAFLGETLNKMTDEEKKSIGSADAFIDRQIAGVNSPWMRFFLTYDPSVALRKVKCPVLAMNGAKDLQVAPKQNLAAIEAALKAGGNTRATIRELPGLNHLFQDAKTGSPDEYQKIDETISPAALQLIAEWILENAK